MPSNRSVLTTTMTVTSPEAINSATNSLLLRDALWPEDLLMPISTVAVGFVTRLPGRELSNNGSMVASLAHSGIYASNHWRGDQGHGKVSVDLCNWRVVSRNCHHFVARGTYATKIRKRCLNHSGTSRVSTGERAACAPDRPSGAYGNVLWQGSRIVRKTSA